MRELLKETAERAIAYREGLDARSIAPTRDALVRLGVFDEPLPENPATPESVVRSLDDEVRQELVKDIREKKLRLAMAVEFDRLQAAAEIENFLAGTFRSATTTAARPRPQNVTRR